MSRNAWKVLIIVELGKAWRLKQVLQIVGDLLLFSYRVGIRRQWISGLEIRASRGWCQDKRKRT
jgi:hypothetical protein